MKKNINATTAISIITIALGILGYVILSNYPITAEKAQQSKTAEAINTQASSLISTSYKYKLNNNSCLLSSCILATETAPEAEIPSIGLAKIKGYYRKVTKTSIPSGCDNNEGADCKEYSSACEEFVITTEIENLFPTRLGLKNPEKIISINLENNDYELFAKEKALRLPENEKNKLLNSNINNQVELLVFKYLPKVGMGTGDCASDNIILRVN